MAYQVTACSLFQLRKAAYIAYIQEADEESELSFETWIKKRESESPQFYFWNLVLQLKILVFVFIRSYRVKFPIVQRCTAVAHTFLFALDQVRYARWLSIHLQDMETLENEMFVEFTEGNFTVYKTLRPFSSMAIDKAHEQNNAYVKGDEKAIGLFEDADALRSWTVTGPEVGHLIGEFETQSAADPNI